MSYLDFFAQNCLRYIPKTKLESKRVLVVGCGHGQDCQAFVGAKVIHGIDICQHIGRDFSHPSVSYFSESAEAMERSSDEYDLVFSVAVLEHIHNLAAALAEIVRVTKPGGLIYTVASPLWNSLEGHHYNDLFSDYPWAHLRLTPDAMKHWLVTSKTHEDFQPWLDLLEKEGFLSEPILDKDIYNYAQRITDFLFSDYFNRTPAKQYCDEVNKLDLSYLIRNDLWYNHSETLTPEILSELSSKGLTKEELLSVSHTFVGIK